VLQKLAGQFESVLTGYGVGKWGPKNFDYGEFSKGLAAIKQIPVCRGCLEGGGADNCPLRACATSKGLDDCTLCDEQMRCPHGERLNRMRTGSRAAGLSVKTAEDERERFLANSETQLKTRGPSCILFLP
jgi:hypothetical protein